MDKSLMMSMIEARVAALIIELEQGEMPKSPEVRVAMAVHTTYFSGAIDMIRFIHAPETCPNLQPLYEELYNYWLENETQEIPGTGHGDDGTEHLPPGSSGNGPKLVE